MNKPMHFVERDSRMLRLFGLITRAIVRSPSPDDLFRDTCRLAVESGAFSLAWVGLAVAPGEPLRVVARCGDAGVPEDRQAPAERLADQVRRAGAARVVSVSMPDTETDELDELLRCGCRSMAGLPLIEAARVAGVLMLCADDAGAFDDRTMSLLHELVDDVAFALVRMRDAQRRTASEAELRRLAYHDRRTGLPNQTLLDERLPLLVAGGGVALFDVRLQRLTSAVRIYDRMSTDEALRAAAARLEGLQPAGSLLAHLGPDEFALAVPGMQDVEEMEACARSLLQALQDPVDVGRGEVFLQPSVGAAAYPLHEPDLDCLLRRARAAAAREALQAGTRIYSRQLDRGLELRLQMEADLHRALEREEFELYYQPQLSLRSGKMVGVEALLYWRHPRRGLVPPGEFVPVLEDCGLMPVVGASALRSACRQAAAWQRQGMPPLRVGVNVSALQFKLSGLVKLVEDTLRESGMDPALLELELTESLILENVDRTVAAMHRLKAIGVALSLDDFGTGYSSLGYLRRYPVERIKIDRSFIGDMSSHAGSAALVRCILAMAANLGLRTIAEGVETFEQFNYLRKLHCDEMQGFLFSEPVPPEEIARMAAGGGGLGVLPGGAAARPTLLLVDSDAELSRQMQRQLPNDRYAILWATSAEEGLRLLAREDVNVVVASAELPDRSGAEFIERAVDMCPGATRILLCPHADFHALADAVNRAGVFRVLSKPVDLAVLAHMVDEALFVSSRSAGGAAPGAARQAAAGS